AGGNGKGDRLRHEADHMRAATAGRIRLTNALTAGVADFCALDFSFEHGSEPPPPPPALSGPPVWPFVAVAMLIVSLGAMWYSGSRGRQPSPAPAKPAAQTTVDLPRRPAEPGERIDLPPLDQSDAVVRTLAGRLSSHPVAAAWLTTEGLVRNLTVVVANIADGQTPAKHL